MSEWSMNTESGIRLVVHRRKAPTENNRFRLLVDSRETQRRFMRIARELGIPARKTSTRLFHYINISEFDDIIAIRLAGGCITMIEEFIENDESPMLPNWNIT